jgi:hypothetical protein
MMCTYAYTEELIEIYLVDTYLGSFEHLSTRKSTTNTSQPTRAQLLLKIVAQILKSKLKVELHSLQVLLSSDRKNLFPDC